MSTYRSRSGRVCSCQKPTTCPSSCTTMPNLSQFLPMLIAWPPSPRLPTNEQQLQVIDHRRIDRQRDRQTHPQSATVNTI